jgi:hypothetical protein
VAVTRSLLAPHGLDEEKSLKVSGDTSINDWRRHGSLLRFAECTQITLAQLNTSVGEECANNLSHVTAWPHWLQRDMRSDPRNQRSMTIDTRSTSSGIMSPGTWNQMAGPAPPIAWATSYDNSAAIAQARWCLWSAAGSGKCMMCSPDADRSDTGALHQLRPFCTGSCRSIPRLISPLFLMRSSLPTCSGT